MAFLTTLIIITILTYEVRNELTEEEEFLKCVVHPFDMNDFNCYQEESNELPPAENFPENSIFYIQTTCRRGLSYREACSVESAAKVHPDRPVNVLFVGPVSQTCLDQEPFAALSKYDNIYYFRIYIENYCRRTALRNLFNHQIFKKSPYRVLHAANILRLVTLMKFGGIYLDLDMIVTKSFDQLPAHRNFIGKTSNTTLGTGVMGLTKKDVGKKIAQISASILKADFDTDTWTAKSISEITEVALENVCTTPDIKKMSKTACQGLTLYPPRYFYAIPSRSWKKLFSNSTMRLDGIYALHTWNQLTFDKKIPKKSLYGKLMRKFCPVIYGAYNNNVTKPKPRKGH